MTAYCRYAHDMREKKHVLPKQPFFVLATNSYSKVILNKYDIAHFYSFKWEYEKNDELLVVPDGCADIVFCYGDGMRWARMYGSVLKAKQAYDDVDKNCQMFGVRFMPGIIPTGFNVKMADIVEKYIPLEMAAKENDFVEKVLSEHDFESRYNEFMKYYLKYYAQKDEFDVSDSLLGYVKKEIVDSGGMTSITQIIEETGYSDRYVIHKMKKEFGMTPKQFSRIIRYQHSLNHLTLAEDEEVEFAELAVQLGYYDQAHMIKEFKEYTGIAPQKYLKLMKNRHFSRRLIIE